MRLICEYTSKETEPEYRARANDFLTSHALIDFLKSPAVFKAKADGAIEDGDSTNYKIGRAAHTLILEGEDAFDKTYVFGGPINPKTGRSFGHETKAFAEWAAQQDREVMPEEWRPIIEGMYESVSSHERAMNLLCDGYAERVVRTLIPLGDGATMPIQSRIDWIAKGCAVIDLKTCHDIDSFERDFWTYRYHTQLAFYAFALGSVLAIQHPPV
jgi:exodeoxyribonuclease VIII